MMAVNKSLHENYRMTTKRLHNWSPELILLRIDVPLEAPAMWECPGVDFLAKKLLQSSIQKKAARMP